MNRVQHLLIKLNEECVEIAKSADKALIFGLDDEYRGKGITPRNDIIQEFNDLIGIIEMLRDEGVDIPILPDKVQAKKAKASVFMDYAEERGTLSRRG